jgi:N-acetylmuramoyl-L-alanine amidase-like protein
MSEPIAAPKEELHEEGLDPGQIPGEQDAPERESNGGPVAPFDPRNEERDLHDGEADAPDRPGDPGRSVDAKIKRKLKIAGQVESTVFDFRDVTSPNGGKIALSACVHHIPVITNVPGRADLDTLRQVLLNQGLMVQFGTDAEGNVAMYTPADRLCFHARGANSVTCGIEHMHFSISEKWMKKQLRAAAWIVQRLETIHGLPLRLATVEPGGAGVARITQTGHTTHQQISAAAGFNDRVDPGAGFDFEYVFHAAGFFKEHGHFVGA